MNKELGVYMGKENGENVSGLEEVLDTESSESPRPKKANKLLGDLETPRKEESLPIIMYDDRYDRKPDSNADKNSGQSSTHYRRKRREVVEKPMGKLIGKIVLQGRDKVSAENYNLSLRAMKTKLPNHQISKLHLVAMDGAHISGIELKNPNATKTIVVLQGQKGNFQTDTQLETLQKIAYQTGANVVAFNYREIAVSQDALVNDASVVCNYLLNRENSPVTPENLCMFGMSLGGDVACLTGKKLMEEGRDVKVVTMNSPRSLAKAFRSMDLRELKDNLQFKLINKFKNAVREGPIGRFLENNNWEMNAEEAAKNLKNLTTVSTKGDKVIGEDAVLRSSENHMDCKTNQSEDKHNASPDTIFTDDRVTVIDALESWVKEPAPSLSISDSN